MEHAQSFKVRFVNGDAKGLCVVEAEDWVGHALKAPRFRFEEAIQREESRQPGVYILIGEDDKDAEEKGYIGEAQNLSNCVDAHRRERDWWTEMWLITTRKHFAFNTERRRYFESYLIQKAKRKKFRLENRQEPNLLKSLEREDQETMERNIIQPLCNMVLPMLGVNFLDPDFQLSKQTTAPEFELKDKTDGLDATARLEDGKWVVQEGSLARSSWQGGSRTNKHIRGSYFKLYEELKEQGVLGRDRHSKHYVFTRDYPFNSQSAATAVIYGRQAAGPRHWKVKGKDTTFKQWEKEQLKNTSKD